MVSPKSTSSLQRSKTRSSSLSSTSLISLSSDTAAAETYAILSVRHKIDTKKELTDDKPYLSIGGRNYHLKAVAIQIGVQQLRDSARTYVFHIPQVKKGKYTSGFKFNSLVYKIVEIQVEKIIKGQVNSSAKAYQPFEYRSGSEVSGCLAWFQVPLDHIPSNLKNLQELFEDVRDNLKGRRNISNAEYTLVEKTLENLVGSNRFYVGSIGEAMRRQGENPRVPIVIELDGQGRCLPVHSNR